MDIPKGRTNYVPVLVPPLLMCLLCAFMQSVDAVICLEPLHGLPDVDPEFPALVIFLLAHPVTGSRS